MPRQLTYRSSLVVGLFWVAAAVVKAYTMSGAPARPLDLFVLAAFSFGAGAYIQRAIQVRRAQVIMPPDTPGGPPQIPR